MRNSNKVEEFMCENNYLNGSNRNSWEINNNSIVLIIN